MIHMSLQNYIDQGYTIDRITLWMPYAGVIPPGFVLIGKNIYRETITEMVSESQLAEMKTLL